MEAPQTVTIKGRMIKSDPGGAQHTAGNPDHQQVDVTALVPAVAAYRRYCLSAMRLGGSIIVATSPQPGGEEGLVAANSILVRFLPQLLTEIEPSHLNMGSGLSRLVATSSLATAGTDICVTDVGEPGLFYILSLFVLLAAPLVHNRGQNPNEAIKLTAGAARSLQGL
ncbi:hypothetical protein [Bradyrhizobium sp. DASA03007]|uniref:hypothetical protein n=1 Tax=unclassified Bradyrhizobium TaxID=2631580 RepID=UPI003F6F6F68